MALPISGFPARVLPLALGAAFFVTSCSSSSDGDASGGITGAVQNLTVDPDGQTLTVDVTGASGVISSVSVEASGGQMAVGVVRTGNSIAVEFDGRVTTDDQVRILGVEGLNDAWRSVTTSDSRVPQVTVLSASQDTSDNVLGGDVVEVAFYSGPRVIESQLLDIDNWTLTVGGLQLNLAGSAVQFDTATQVGQLTLGPLANLHAQFTIQVDAESVAAVTINPAAVNGTATGDSVAPSLEGGSPVTQTLDTLAGGDEYGRVVEFDFDEPISPVFGAQPGNFSVVDHPQATASTTITRATVSPLDPSIVRVHFSRPVVPGLDQIAIDGLVDAHGNPFTPQSVAIEAGSTVVNSFQSVDFLTLEGLENDAVVAVLAQALDPDSADLDSRWTLTVGGVGLVDLTTQEISYDLLSKTVRFDLDFDVTNGTTADLVSVGGIDIDGEDFSVAAAQVTAAGDAATPEVEELTQNRSVDTEGRTVDVRFSEALDVVTATDTNNYTFNPAIVINGAMLVDGTTVRLELADVAIPGDVTLSVAQAVSDPAGNDLGAGFGPSAITTTDNTAPAPIVAAASAIEGIDNDTLTVLFNDMLIPAEVESVGNWMFESPVGQAVDLLNATVSYDANIRVATLHFAGPDGFALLGTDDFAVAFANLRDLGGNSVDANPIGGAILAEGQRPALESGYAVSGGAGNQIIIRFSEPMRNVENLYNASTNATGVRFGQVDSVTSVETFPQTALSLDDGLGVLLTFGAAIDTSGSLNIIGLIDLAGNLLFPVLGLPIAPEQVTAPGLGSSPSLLASSGIDNDTITLQFGVPMSRWRLLDPSQYTLRESISGTVIDLTGATFSFDGNDTVTVGLIGPAFEELGAAIAYDLDLNQDPADPLRSVQGVPIAAPETAASVAVTGDVVNGPTNGGSLALVDPLDGNSAIIVFDETVDMLSALSAPGYDFNGSTALSLTEYSARSVRATFSIPVTIGGTLEIQNTAAVDSAGNAAGGLISLAVTEDTTAPTISSTVATVTQGAGGDTVVLTFNEELDPAQASNRSNYLLTVGGQAIRVATATYSTNDGTVTLVPDDLEDGATVLVTVDGVGDLSGNLPVAPLADSAIASGDSDAPTILSATVNLTANGSGLVVDVLFSEDVDPGFADQWYNWTTDGFAHVDLAEALAPDHVQLLLDSPLAVSEMLTLFAGMTDPAGNQAIALTVDPVE